VKRQRLPHALLVLGLVALVLIPMTLGYWLSGPSASPLATETPLAATASIPVLTPTEIEPQTARPIYTPTTGEPSHAPSSGATPTQALPTHVIPTPARPLTTTAWASLPMIEPSNASRVEEIHRFGRGHLDRVAWSPNGNCLAVATAMGIWLYDYPDFAEGQLIPFPSKLWVFSIAFSPDGKTLVTASTDDNLRLWDLETMALKRLLLQSPDLFRAVAFSPDGQYIAAGGDDHELWLVNANTGEVLGTYEGLVLVGKGQCLDL